MRPLAYILLPAVLLARPGTSAAGGEDPLDMHAVESLGGRTVSGVSIKPDIGIEDPTAFLDLEETDVLSRELVDDIIRKIWGTGRVAKVSVYAEPEGTDRAVLVVRVELRMHLHSVKFDGNDHIDSEELKDVTGFRPGMEIFDDTLEKFEKKILERYALRGYPYAALTLSEQPMDEPDKIKLTVKMDEGRAIRMWKIRFAGRPIFSPLRLQKITKLRHGDVYDQVKIEKGLENLKVELKTIGFYNCDIYQPGLSLDEKSRLIVKIEVDPGPNYDTLFIGNDHLSSAKIEEILEIEKQPAVGPAVLAELSEKLEDSYRKLGFTMVSVSADMYTKKGGREGIILFSVKEGQRMEVKEIKFAGNNRFSSHYLRKEFIAVLNQNLDYKMLFVIPSHEAISELGISGTMPEPAKKFGKRTKPLQPWPPKKIFLKESYQKAAEHIEELYAAEGYLEAQVMEPAIKIDEKGRYMTVVFVIKEGRRTWIEKVAFKGVKKVDKEDLLDAAGILPGKPFNGMAVKDSESAILDFYHTRGYRFATLTSNIEYSEDGTEANITYEIEEGPLVYVESIAVRGNVSTKKSLIEDRVTLKPGSIFTLQEQKDSSGHLRELGIFNSVVISMEEPAIISDRKRALVQLSEKKAQFLELRAGASSGEGLRGGMEYGYKNLLGYALDFGFIVNINYRFFFVGTGRYFPKWYQNELSLLKQLERNIAVKFGIPHLPRIGRWLTIQMSFGHLRKNSNLYGLTKNSVYTSFLVTPISPVHFSVRTGFEDSDVGTNTVAERAITSQIQELPVCTPEKRTECLSTQEKRALRVPVGKTAFSVLGTDFTLDMRDNAFNPKSGLRLSMGMSWIRSTDHAKQIHRVYADNEAYKTYKTYAFSNLLRNTVSLSGYIPLGTKKVVLMLYGAAGYIIQLQDESETFADRLFYLGGGHTMRGFPEESLCAVESPPGICAYGGNLMLNYKIELMFPIYKELGGAVFSDIGNLWKEPEETFKFFDLRATVGLGIRYSTPIGPLNFDYGFIVNRDESRGDPFGAVHFSIGTF